jgi:hypothetical protein
VRAFQPSDPIGIFRITRLSHLHNLIAVKDQIEVDHSGAIAKGLGAPSVLFDPLQLAQEVERGERGGELLGN